MESASRYWIWVITSHQSNLRRERRSSADKTSSKLLGSHSPSMLTVRSRSMLKYGRRASHRIVITTDAVGVLRLFWYIFAHEFLFNPHFDLEPDYIIRKGMRHRIQRYTMRTEILLTFHTRVEWISQRHITPIETNACADAEKCHKPCQKHFRCNRTLK